MSDIKRPVLRYHGGKFLLAKWIISHFPDHKVYTEVFGGGGSVLMLKPRAYAEVYNDKWDTVVNVFRVLRDPVSAGRLEQLLRLTPFSRTEFVRTGYAQIDNAADPVEKARLTIFRSFAAFGSASTNGKHSTGFRAKSWRSSTTPARDWANYPNNIQSFVDRLKGVVIENKDYREVFLQHDSEDTLHYVDPPYPHSTRNMARGNASYAHEFTDQDHIDMADSAKALRGGVIISGYDCELYQELFKGWHVSKKMALADGARPRTECLWINDRAASKLNKKLF